MAFPPSSPPPPHPVWLRCFLGHGTLTTTFIPTGPTCYVSWPYSPLLFVLDFHQRFVARNHCCMVMVGPGVLGSNGDQSTPAACFVNPPRTPALRPLCPAIVPSKQPQRGDVGRPGLSTHARHSSNIESERSALSATCSFLSAVKGHNQAFGQPHLSSHQLTNSPTQYRRACELMLKQ